MPAQTFWQREVRAGSVCFLFILFYLSSALDPTLTPVRNNLPPKMTFLHKPMNTGFRFTARFVWLLLSQYSSIVFHFICFMFSNRRTQRKTDLQSNKIERGRSRINQADVMLIDKTPL